MGNNIAIERIREMIVTAEKAFQHRWNMLVSQREAIIEGEIDLDAIRIELEELRGTLKLLEEAGQ